MGIGAFGAGDADGLHRFGEFLAVSGAAACLPADGTEVPDYLVASGAEAPSVRVSRGLVCDGGFARHLRFEATDRGGVVPLADVRRGLPGAVAQRRGRGGDDGRDLRAGGRGASDLAV